MQQHLATVGARDYNRECLLFLTCRFARQIWGDPKLGKSLDNADDTVGCFHQSEVLFEYYRQQRLKTG